MRSKKVTCCKRAALHLRRDRLRLAYTPKEVFASIHFLIPCTGRLRAGQHCEKIGKRKIAIGPPFVYFGRVINPTAKSYQIRRPITEERNRAQTNLLLEPWAFIVSVLLVRVRSRKAWLSWLILTNLPWVLKGGIINVFCKRCSAFSVLIHRWCLSHSAFNPFNELADLSDSYLSAVALVRMSRKVVWVRGSTQQMLFLALFSGFPNERC